MTGAIKEKLPKNRIIGLGIRIRANFIPQSAIKHLSEKMYRIASVRFDASGASFVNSKTYYHADHLGSAMAVTDTETTIVFDRTYFPYGKKFDGVNTVSNSHQYTGKEFQGLTEQYYYGARYYSPSLGRFLITDPAGISITNPQSWNRYAYVQNNPFTYVDPDGRFPLLAIIIPPILTGLGLIAEEVANAPESPDETLVPALTDTDVIVQIALASGGTAVATEFVGIASAQLRNQLAKAAIRGTFTGGKFRNITLQTGTQLKRVFQKGVNRPVGQFTTRGSTTSRLTSTERAMKELGIRESFGVKPNRLATLETTAPINAKIGFIKDGGKRAVQIVIDKKDLNKIKEIRGLREILK